MPALRGPDGKIVYVDENEVSRYTAGGDYQPVSQAAAGAEQSAIAPIDTGTVGSIRAGLSSVLSGATLGATDWALGNMGSVGDAEQLANERRANPTISSLGQAAGMVLPAVISGGSITPSGYLSKLAAGGIEAGQAAGGVAGTARALAAAGTEGAIQNAGVYLSDVALGDRDLSAEGINGALGTGFAFGTGGLAAAHGIEAGTIAARRMFARYAEGGTEAARAAAQTWKEGSASSLEAFDQTAELAQAKLREATAAREQAAAAHAEAVAGVADARAIPPELDLAAKPPGPNAMTPEDAARVFGGEGIEMAPPAGAEPPGPVSVPFMVTRQMKADLMALGHSAEEIANMTPKQAWETLRSKAAPISAEAAELSANLAEYRAARQAFDEAHAAVDPDLEAALRGMMEPELRWHPQEPVPVGEFGAPGQGGFKTPDELARLAAGTDVPAAPALEATGAAGPKALRGGAQGTPVIGAATTPAKALSDSEFGEMADKWQAGLSPEAKQSLETYSRNGTYGVVNANLRRAGDLSQVPDYMHKLVRDIDEAIETAPAARPMTVTRGLNQEVAIKQWDGVAPGDTIVDHGFGSTSASPKVGQDYAKGWEQRPGVRLEIEVPKGYPAAPVPSEIFGSEKEILLPRNTKYTVNRVEEVDGVKVVHVTASRAAEGEVSKVGAKLNAPTDINQMNIRQLEDHMDVLDKRKNELDFPGKRGPELDKVKAEYEAAYERHRAIRKGEVPEPSGTPPRSSVAAREVRDEAEFRAMQADLRAKLSPDEIKQAIEYSKEYYTPVNRELRGVRKTHLPGDTEKIAEIIPALDSAISKSVTSEPLVVHRAMHFDPGEELNGVVPYDLKPGDTFSDPAYLSASFKSDNIHRFGNIHFVIEVPSGSHLAAIPSNKSEGELLMPRGTQLRITGRDVQPNGRVTLRATVDGPASGAGESARSFVQSDRHAGGTQGGKWYSDQGGNQWFGKSYKGNADRVEVEHVANQIYRTMGVSAPETEIAEIGGRKTMMSKELPGQSGTAADLSASNVKDGFVVDAWLGNRDVLGTGNDNVLIEGGRAHRIDNGGSLMFRATGGEKEFGRAVTELESMRDPKYSAGKVFGSLTKDEVNNQLRAFAENYRKNADAIDRIIDSSGLSPGLKARAMRGLHDRAAWLIERAPKGVAADTLTGQLRGTADRLASGASLSDIGASSPARAEYVANKAARTEEAAAHFRGRANAENFAKSEMGAAEREAQATARPGTPTSVFKPEDLGLEFDAKARAYRDPTGRAMEQTPVGERGIGLAPRVEPAEVMHPLDIKRLEMEHDAAVERAATAADPAERAAAKSEARALEKQMTGVGARPGAVEDVAAMAQVVTRVERAAAKLTESMGDAAPAAAREHAQAFRAAEDDASRKTVSRIAQAADDHAASAAQPPAMPRGQRINDAKIAEIKARENLSQAERVEARARKESIGADKVRDAARKGAAAPTSPAAESALPGKRGGRAGQIAAGARAAGVAVELAGDFGIPGIPRVHDIPVIGPLLSMYLKYRAFRAAAGRFVGRVPASGEARAAALASRTKDGIARAVDRSLGLVERNPGVVRGVLTAGAIEVSKALSKRVIDDGGPDAGSKATPADQAAVRIREIAAAVTNPKLVSDMVRNETRGLTDPDLIMALENHLMAMYQHLHEVAPKGPPPNPYTKTEWKPSPADALQFGRRLAVVNNPVAAFDALQAGTLTPGPAETLRICYARLFEVAQQRLIQRAADLRNPVAYPQLMQSALLFKVPLHPSLEPGNAAVLATAHEKPPAQPQGGPSAGPAPSIADPTNLTSLYQTSADRRATAR